ncbi:MAG: LapA family protein [Pseudomonadota bacterium]
MRILINTCGIVLVLLLLVSFAMKNAQPVELNYYLNISYSIPAWGLVLFPFFTGVIVGNLLDVLQKLKLKSEIRKLKKAIQSRN